MATKKKKFAISGRFGTLLFRDTKKHVAGDAEEMVIVVGVLPRKFLNVNAETQYAVSISKKGKIRLFRDRDVVDSEMITAGRTLDEIMSMPIWKVG